jgi:hypothetical protein
MEPENELRWEVTGRNFCEFRFIIAWQPGMSSCAGQEVVHGEIEARDGYVEVEEG